jgi:hypothetical protein
MEYHTPVGTISTLQIYTEHLRKAGSTIPFLAGHPIKKKEDYRVLAFLEAVRKHRPQVVGLSALLTTTMPEMKRVIEDLGRSGLREEVKVLIGGGAGQGQVCPNDRGDGSAADAAEAVEKAHQLLAP